MAFTDLGSLGATGSSANNQTQLDLSINAPIAVGDFVVICVATDNILNIGGDDNAVTSVTLGTAAGSQVLSKAVQVANDLGGQLGASSSVWYGVANSALASGSTIRAVFGSTILVDASGITSRKFSVAAGNTVKMEGVPGTLISNTAADPGSPS